MSVSFTQVKPYVEPNPDRAKTVEIKTIFGCVAVLTYGDATKVEDLKTRIFQNVKDCLPEAQQRLVLEGKILKDGDLVAAKISGNSPIYLVWQSEKASQTESY
jgi:hypothetical protein